MSDVRDVEIAVDGDVVRGRFRPGDGPAVLMTHGFAATVDMGLEEYAEVFSAAGLGVLAYDHRHFGRSAGEPRQVINPWRQARDQQAVLGWLAAQPGVDPARLGLWGSSYSGGQVLVLGAVDPRVKAVVASVPYVGRFPGFDADGAFEALRAALLDDTADAHARATGPLGDPVRVVTDADGSGQVLPQPEAAEWFGDRGRRPGSPWRNQVHLVRAFDTMPVFDPAIAAPHLAVPTLFVIATHDDVAPTETAEQVAALVPGPVRVVSVEGHHFTPYAGAGLEVAAAAARDWFRLHL